MSAADDGDDDEDDADADDVEREEEGGSMTSAHTLSELVGRRTGFSESRRILG